MNLAHTNGHHLLVLMTREEAETISNALNELCNGFHLSDAEFQTRMGADRPFVEALLGSMHQFLDAQPREFDVVEAWVDGASVQAKCVSAYGDAVDMSSTEARRFAEKLVSKADAADFPS
jgi:hypothetical protein